MLSHGYEVHGTSRDARVNTFHNLIDLGIRDKVSPLSLNLSDYGHVQQTLADLKVDEIYNLSAQSSVGLSFEKPRETIESIAGVTLNLLEAIRNTCAETRFFNAGSGECFGDTLDAPADEERQFRSKSPYAVAKAEAVLEVAGYRETYSLFGATGILFNHESPLRSKRFVTQKIISAVKRVAGGDHKKLQLGDISVVRDWGWAPEYVEAMWLMLQQDEPDDFVIATGEAYGLEEFVDQAFKVAGLDWRDHVVVDKSLFRPADLMKNYGNPKKAKEKLGWKAKYAMPDTVKELWNYSKQAS